MNDTPSTELIAAARAALQGRRYPPELLARIDALPDQVLHEHPWLALLQGRRLCRLHSRFAEATPLIDDALAAFRAAGDSEGELWALAEWLVMRYHAHDYAAGLAEVGPVLDWPMRPYLRAELLFGRFLCLIGSSQVRTAVDAGTAALAALDADADPWLQRIGRIQMLRNIAAGFHYLGEARRSLAAAERAAALAQEHPDTADMRPWCFYELGLAYWRTGRLAAATETLDRARRLAEEWQHRELWRWAVATQGHVLRDQDRLDAALAAYQLANCWGEDPEGPAFIQLRQGRLAEARWSCEMLLALNESAGSRGDALFLLGLVELKSSRPAEALALFERAAGFYDEAGYGYNNASLQLYRAAAGLVLDRGDIVEAGLAAFLRVAASEELLTCAWWIPDLIEALLFYATQHGIEPEWAQRQRSERFSLAPQQAPRPVSPRDLAELEIARRMQLSLLPELPPVMPDLDIAALVLPAAEIGGDFVGYFPRGADPEADTQRRLGIAVGDISGKGLGAALLLSGAVVTLNTVAAGGAPPAQVAKALHDAMRPYTSRSRMNIALCYAQFTQHTGGWALCTVGAGAVAPLLRRAAGTVEWLETTGFPLGTFAAAQPRELKVDLAPGDALLLMSDGIVEAMSPARELFGFERLAQTMANLPAATDAHGVRDAVVEAVRRHTGAAEQQDDITLVVVRVVAGAAGRDT
jgi:tetratricopeptide (TPR) repeat protein